MGSKPFVAAAIHDGHDIRKELVELMVLNEKDRQREEDPYTSFFTKIAETQIIASHSRFELDLNRPRHKAVYLEPEDSWGLNVWGEKPSQDQINKSLRIYDDFYKTIFHLFNEMQHRYKKFVVYDLHSYNHYRDGMDKSAADPAYNPEVNIGTGTMERKKWSSIIDRFIYDLKSYDYLGRNLDVRENIKFKGGHFARWSHENFPDSACVLSIEFKKFFMNEWTGEIDNIQLKTIRNALESTVTGVIDILTELSF